MPSHKVSFPNRDGYNLIGRLDVPDDNIPHAFAIFGHCFTCTRNLTAIGHISRGLMANGYAVLRFDFTGLGDSEGDFSDTNFTSNVEDMKSAAQYLQQEHGRPPCLAVGHSFGGAAALKAATELESLQAVVAIAAPSEPLHIIHILGDKHQKALEEYGETEVVIAGKTFKLKRQFLEDVRKHQLRAKLGSLDKAVLILHSPVDEMVTIENAADIYAACKQPKSFVSLDTADHVLSNTADSQYVGHLIGVWASRYVATGCELKS